MTNPTQTEIKDAMMDIFLKGLNVEVTSKIEEILEAHASPLIAELNEKMEKVEAHRSVHVHIKDKVRVFEGSTHEKFSSLLSAVSTKMPVMIVGPAGTGKTYASEQVSKALGINFYSMSVGAQTSKSDIGGYMNANGAYVRSQFRDAFEFGGVFLMDEIDAGNANVLIFTNAALSGTTCAFPDGMVKKHEDFYFVATANTYGLGANRQYVGRNQLDAATLDRFITLDWPVDERLEEAMVSHYSRGLAWHRVVLALREKVSDAQYKIVVSPRATLKGSLLFEAGFKFDEVLSSVVLSSTSKDQATALREVANMAWERNRHLIRE